METLNRIKEMVEQLNVDTTKFFENENKSAGVRARKEAQDIKGMLQELRKEILQKNKS
tara:strand:+ start:526 stop:699 length:174 start_codon:yes stop_codon:yes gene_type:complete